MTTSCKRIVVTGAEGFIGSHLAATLEGYGHNVRKHSLRDGDIAQTPLEYSDIDHVFHLAARTSVLESWNAPRTFYETNVLGTVNVLELCRRAGASLTYLSSYVYGVPSRLPIDEDQPLQAFNPYCSSKILAEKAVHFYTESFNVSATIVRPFNVYGPGQTDTFLIPMILQQAISRESQSIHVADDRPKRDHLFITDLVDLLLKTMGGSGLHIYNAGSGYSVGIPQIVELVNELLQTCKPLVSRGERRPSEVMDVVADISRAKACLGWHPRISLREGLKTTISGMMK